MDFIQPRLLYKSTPQYRIKISFTQSLIINLSFMRRHAPHTELIFYSYTVAPAGLKYFQR